MKTPPASTFVDLNDAHATDLIYSLVQEINQLESKLDNLQTESREMDFSMTQTFKEMIHSRKGMLHELQRQKL